MDKSTYIFSLAGKEIALKFTWGALKKLRNLLNADPLTTFAQLSGTVETVEFALNVIVCCSGISKEEIDQLSENELPGNMIEVTRAVIKAFNNGFVVDEAGGEAGADTQQGQAA